MARALAAKQPIVSTSANLSGQPPAKDEEELMRQFPLGINALVQGQLGGFIQPSAIYNVLNNQQLR